MDLLKSPTRLKLVFFGLALIAVLFIASALLKADKDLTHWAFGSVISLVTIYVTGRTVTDMKGPGSSETP